MRLRFVRISVSSNNLAFRYTYNKLITLVLYITTYIPLKYLSRIFSRNNFLLEKVSLLKNENYYICGYFFTFLKSWCCDCPRLPKNNEKEMHKNMYTPGQKKHFQTENIKHYKSVIQSDFINWYTIGINELRFL